MNSKLYKSLNEKLEKTIAGYTEALRHLDEEKSKAAAKLQAVTADRASVMSAGDLEKARKMKNTISDLESDIEVYGVQIEKLTARKNAELTELANSIKDQVHKEEAVQHKKDRAEVIKKAQEIITFLDSMEEGLQTGNDLILEAMTAAGMEDQCGERTSYFNVVHGKKLLIQLRKACGSIIDIAEGKTVIQGINVDDIDKWL